jgi:hypothetical protein
MTADRKQTPDILGSLLGDKKAEEKEENTIKPEYHKDSKPVKQPTSKPVSHKNSKTEVKSTSKPDKATVDAPKPARESSTEASEEKVKATYYLAIEAVEALEEGWYQLRKMASTDNRTSISKSLIVETALQIVLEELVKSGQKSRIAKRLLK